jgi:TAT (twin-arginine translocation) pathway signal sequence
MQHMNRKSAREVTPNSTDSLAKEDEHNSEQQGAANRRSFLKTSLVAGAVATAGVEVLAKVPFAFGQTSRGSLTKGDVAILRFLAAAEIIESDLWLQYQELGGVQDDEVSKLASKLIPGYPAQPTGGNPLYMQDLLPLDSDMSQYIHDNTEDELTHEVFINEYLASKGAEKVSLDQFRTLSSSKATGANQFGRLTNLMQLTVDTSWWTRYRSRTKNPDFGDMFQQAIPTLAVGQHPAVPRTDSDANDANFFQAIVNTAGFHFAFIEQGGSSLYPQLAQRVSNVEVLRILLSIGGVEIAHFQTWHDKAGNAPQLTDVVDPVTGVKVTFPDLNSPPFGGEDFQTNLIMPEPTVFLNKHLPACSIIRPTETKGAAMAALASLTADGLFIGQSKAFFEFVRDLAESADAARREE